MGILSDLKREREIINNRINRNKTSIEEKEQEIRMLNIAVKYDVESLEVNKRAITEFAQVEKRDPLAGVEEGTLLVRMAG